MKSIKKVNAILYAPIFSVVFLSLPLSAYADWSNPGMQAGIAPNLVPHQGQPIHHDVNITPTQRVEPQHRAEAPRPAHQATPPAVNHMPAVRNDRPVEHRQVIERSQEHVMPGYFRRDAEYYGHVEVPFPYADVDSPFVVPDGFETVMVNGETFYYHQGVFYQEVDDQLVAIPAVLGAVVDNIPQDYQIVMADGVHYLFTSGVYYQRVDQGFEVVDGPDTQGS